MAYGFIQEAEAIHCVLQLERIPADRHKISHKAHRHSRHPLKCTVDVIKLCVVTFGSMFVLSCHYVTYNMDRSD